jgi:hypothetical protein
MADLHTLKLDAYTGVTGFMDGEAAEVAASAAAAVGALLMVGVLASPKTLSGKTNSKPNRYPKREDIAGIFPEISSTTLNLIHLGGVDNPSELYHWMRVAARYGGENFEGFQINAAWPDPDAFRKWRQRCKMDNPTIVLQVGPQAIEQAGRDPRRIVKKLYPYLQEIDHVLIDGSGGEQKELDVPFTVDCIGEIQAMDWGLGVAVAGGLRGSNLDTLIEPIFQRFNGHSDVGTDTEGGMRDEDDHLVIPLVLEYIGGIADLRERHAQLPQLP